jgi:DNA-binding NtrC family response regulator
VLLTGETGTGKELFARALHYNGPRRAAPFVDVNCAAIPDQLLESELFGHEKGAFTDAGAAKPGLFEIANGGTLFLDEIGHLPLALQGKLLRALQERTARRVGGTRAFTFDVRVVAATHVDLAQAVRQRAFREDLYYRLNVVPVHLPPLRERAEDVVPLVRHFLARLAAEYGLPVPVLGPGAERALARRRWPGNVRELRNATERALLLAVGPTLDAVDFAVDGGTDDVHGAGGAGGALAGGGGVLPFPATVREIVQAASAAMLEACGGNKSETARRLGVSRSRLARLLDGTDTDDA